MFGALFIIFGFFLALFGKKLFSITLFIVGMAVAIGAILFLFYGTFLSKNTELWVFWTVLAGSFLVGLLAGYLLYKC